ncbi:MAG: DUF6285 domain-containing protein [Acidobacteriota bacterium]
MLDRPTSSELLGTLAELLDDEVLPAVDGLLKHKVRVAANLCRILEREAQTGRKLEEREIELLAEVTGAEGSAEELSTLLCERLSADDEELERRAFPALLEIVRGKLSVNKPGHDGYDFAAERGRES